MVDAVFRQNWSALMILLMGVTLTGCQKVPSSSTSDDDLDTSKMVYGSAPATVTNQRHTGPLFKGSALSIAPNLRPLDPSPNKVIQLDTGHGLWNVAPGVVYSGWNFGGTIPGPIIRVRVGDKVHISTSNRTDELSPGQNIAPEPMMHSIDLHAAMVAPNDKYRSIAPGQTLDFDWTPNYPGVFLYHCGTPMVLEHMAEGMYGMVIVEPKGGYPTKVDREYAIIQSEFYLKPDPQKRMINNQPLYVMDSDKLRIKQSTYTIFNGIYNGMMNKPIVAKPGERVRLFLLNVGPSNTSSFHVVGTIFDRVWMDGNPHNETRGRQTVLLGSSNGAIVEFVVPEKGDYTMVDHHFSNASQGAVGLLDASGGSAAARQGTEHHNIPATSEITDPAAAAGRQLFDSKCLACHSLGQGPKLGPDLAGVTQRHPDDWLQRWLTSPENMLATDATAKALLAQYKVPMPNQNLNQADIDHLLKLFHFVDMHQEHHH